MKMQNHSGHSTNSNDNSYKKLLIMAVISFISMYILMYSMVDVIGNVLPNVNQFYMAGLMASPMIIIEILLMRSMYKIKKLNIIIITISCLALIVFFAGIRQQAGISDRQFLKSMIPHHAAAILMGKKASVKDPEIKELIKNIILSQQTEIEQMKAKLKEMDK